jgi:hypothetical protein
MVSIPRDEIKYYFLRKFVLVRGCLLDLIPTAMSKLFIISADIPPAALL